MARTSKRSKVTYHHKLVRDGIPKKIRKGGEIAECRTLTQHEKMRYLFVKLVEESNEALAAFLDRKKDRMLEIVDVLEVVDELLSMHGLSKREMRALQAEKRRLVGGFKGGTYLESTRRP